MVVDLVLLPARNSLGLIPLAEFHGNISIQYTVETEYVALLFELLRDQKWPWIYRQIFPILSSTRNGHALSFESTNSNGGFEELWGVEKKTRRVPVAAVFRNLPNIRTGGGRK